MNNSPFLSIGIDGYRLVFFSVAIRDKLVFTLSIHSLKIGASLVDAIVVIVVAIAVVSLP